jgi:hypothetical protein
MTARVCDTPQVGTARHSSAPDLRSIAIDSTPLRLQRALAQVEELKRKLASSQQQSIVAQQQLARSGLRTPGAARWLR